MQAKDKNPSINRASSAGVALLIIDMINPLDFEGAEDLLPKVDAVAGVVLRLRGEADRLDVPVIYVNDNYGHWHSEHSRLIDACMAGPGGHVVRRVAPRESDFFVIKPQFSGFYATNLPVLIPQLGVDRLVLTGIAADICVLFTAADAHMRQYGLWVPADGVASERDEETRWALGVMKKSMEAETRPTDQVDLASWIAAGSRK